MPQSPDSKAPLRRDSVAELDIVIPVYNEGRNINATLAALDQAIMRTWVRVLIVYDLPDDDTLPAVRAKMPRRFPVIFVRNQGVGAHAAVMTGFFVSAAPYVLMYPADDHTNGWVVDAMMQRAAQAKADIVCVSRFMPGGAMVGCPWLKAVLVRCANFTLHYLARLPATDASNGFRMFSRRVLETIPVESSAGFCYSIELLVKAHRLGYRVAEVPVQWFERQHGSSRFRVIRWLPAYLRWYAYAFATALLRRKAL